MNNRNLKPCITVVVPVYNRLTYLDATINSVLAQTEPNWELIIVDDGSQEDVAGFMAQYTDARIRFIRQDNQGNAAARNIGIQQSQGEYVICLDSDDVWHPEMLQATASVLNSRSEVDVVYTQVQSIDANGHLLPRRAKPQPMEGDLLEPLLLAMSLLPSSALVRRSCFEKWGLYTPGLDDWELWLRWAVNGCYFVGLDRPLLYYRVHDQNFNLDWQKRREAHFAMLDKFYTMDKLPELAVRLRKQVYARQYLHFALLAQQIGPPDNTWADFKQAIFLYPDYLANLDVYTSFACTHQSRLDMGTSKELNLIDAESSVRQALDILFLAEDLPRSIKSKQKLAYGFAYLALGRLAYGVGRHKGKARRFLWQGFELWPALLWRTDWALWLARALVGFDELQRIKHVLAAD